MSLIHSSSYTSSRLGHLVRVVTEQDEELSGFHAPVAVKNAPLLLCVHGLSGGMDTSFVCDFLSAPELQGWHILTINTKGHGNIAMRRSGNPLHYRLDGSAFERFVDCVYDLSAWMDYAARATQGPIVLLGHSLGASKVTYYQGQVQDARVFGLILASAPDLKGAFIALHGEHKVSAYLDQARTMVAQGAGRMLMDEECVIGLLRQRVSAQTLLDRFDDDQPADVFDFFNRGSKQAFQALRRIKVPILALYGESGEIVGEGGTAAAIGNLQCHAVQAESFDSMALPANHWYMGAEQQAAQAVARWLNDHVSVSSRIGEAYAG